MTEELTGGFQSEQTEVCGSKVCTSIFTLKAEIFNIAFFQFLGMVLFTYVVLIYNGIITGPGIWVVEIGMFFALVFSGSYGCGYLNPALTLACCIRREKRIDPLIGLFYWIIQYIAAFAGTFIAWAYKKDLAAPFPQVHANDAAWQTFGKEILGSFVFIFCVLIMISSDTTFTRNNFHTWFCVPLCLIAVCSIFNLGLGTNPAQALAFQVGYLAMQNQLWSTKIGYLNKIWSVIVGATLGGALAGIIFEFVYRPYTKVYREDLYQNGQTRKPIKIGLLNKTLDTTAVTYPRRTTNIQMS